MKARQYVQNNGIMFKHVWIVYDTDDFPAENIDMVAQLCEEYSAQGETIYHAVWSNQCIELWYLMHRRPNSLEFFGRTMEIPYNMKSMRFK